jgi:hypothetical protein
MSGRNTNQDVRHVRAGRDRRPMGRVDFTFMYAAHDAFNRDLRRLAAAGPLDRQQPCQRRLLGMLPAPARLVYRVLWRPSYARVPRWNTA